MCEVCMFYRWLKDTGEPINQLCRCINGKVTYAAKSVEVKDASIRQFNNRKEALAYGWKYNRNNEWTCPECRCERLEVE